MADYGSLKNYQNSNFLFQERKMFVCLELWQKYQYFLTKHVPLCNQSIFFYACNRPSFIDLGAQTCLERTYCDMNGYLRLKWQNYQRILLSLDHHNQIPFTKILCLLFFYWNLKKERQPGLLSFWIATTKKKLNKDIYFWVFVTGWCNE